MRRAKSPTLLGLIVLGFVLVALPLIVTLVTAIVRVDRLARESRVDMMTVQENAVASRGLLERTTSMERSARQFEALGDPSFTRLYGEHRAAALGLLDRLVAGSRSTEIVAALDRYRQAERQVSKLLYDDSRGEDGQELDSALEALRGSALDVVREQNTISRAMASILPDKAKSLQHSLIIQAMFVIPVSAGLAAFLFFVIATPLRQIGTGIRSLGQGTLGEPIRIRGARDLEELGQRLEWLRRRLVELEAQKSQFLRNVSHELKTPLTNIREGAELLSEDGEDGAPGDREQVARIVRSNSIRLQRMIEELLRYGAEGDMTAGQPDQDIRLDNLVMEVIERHRSDAAARPVALRQSLEPVRLPGNRKRLEVIVDNLLSNAVKYTPAGGRVDVTLDSRDGQAVLDVSDSGPGVPHEDRDRIFEWFYTGARPPGAVVAGSGMGLAIAQEYAAQHGGKIELLPSDSGALFRLTIGKPG